MSRVTNITIGRLFNLGNYEHVRYELTVELQPGESAAETLAGLENVMNALDPKPPGNVADSAGLFRSRQYIEQAKEESEEHIQLYHGTDKATHLAKLEKEHEEMRVRSLAWFERRDKARQLLDDLGGASKWVDDKINWEDS